MPYCEVESFKNLEVYIPIHITGFFKPYIYQNNLLNSGSIGAGLVLEKFVRVKIQKIDIDTINHYNSHIHIEYVFNKPTKKVEVVDYIVKYFENLLASKNLHIKIRIELPVRIGLGYGVSSAIALGLSIILSIITKSLTIIKATHIAHIAEVKALTGLGDVIAEFFGGPIEIRLRPGPPGVGFVDKIALSKSIKVITIELSEEETTKRLILNASKIDETLVKTLIDELIENPSIETYIQCCRKFNDTLKLFDKLPKKIQELINRTKVLGFHVKKNLIVLIVEYEYLNDVIDYLSKLGIEHKVFNTTFHGVIIRYD